MALPIYLVSPAGPHRDAHVAELGATVDLFESPEAFGDPSVRPPGLILVDRVSFDAAAVLWLADRVAASVGEWTLAVIDGDGEPYARTVSMGLPARLPEVGTKSADPENSKGVLIELRAVLREVAKARHDINNPLTAALAEVQILLMDVTDEEIRESLEITQRQLRKMRDLLAATGHIRLPTH